MGKTFNVFPFDLSIKSKGLTHDEFIKDETLKRWSVDKCAFSY